MVEEAQATARAPGGRRGRGVVVGVLLALALGVVLRFVTRSDLWLDEALTVNIAKLPLGQLHDALRHDGAPPAYYLLLHGWISAFGSGDVSVRFLSGFFGLVSLPLAWFAGRRLGGRAVAWAAVLVLASSPYAIRYSTETRMYSLVILLVLAAYLLLLRVLEHPTLARTAPLALVTGLLLYTQYWSIYLLLVVGAGLVVRAVRSRGDERRAAVSALVALAAGCVLFVPWLPTFSYQLQHTGTPWGSAVAPPTAFGVTFIEFSGGEHAETVVLIVLLVVLALLGLFGTAAGGRHVDLDLRTRPTVRWETATLLGALAVGTTWSFLGDSAFQGRYAAIVFPLFVLAVAAGTAVFGDRRVYAGVVAAVVLLGLVGGVRNAWTHRTQAYQVAAKIDDAATGARPGDVVVYCPDQVGPAVSRLLDRPDRLRQMVFPTGAAPDRIDWVDYAKRNTQADPEAFAQSVLRAAGTHDVWYVYAPGYKTFEGKCEALQAALQTARPHPVPLVLPDSQLFEFQGLVRYPGS
ncbi:MAG: glycosyltransferase family 39 protein [Acidimicrobiia bacterium]